MPFKTIPVEDIEGGYVVSSVQAFIDRRAQASAAAPPVAPGMKYQAPPVLRIYKSACELFGLKVRTMQEALAA